MNDQHNHPNVPNARGIEAIADLDPLKAENAVLRQALESIYRSAEPNYALDRNWIIMTIEEALEQTTAVPVVPLEEAEALAAGLEGVIAESDRDTEAYRKARSAITAYRSRHQKPAPVQ